MPSGQMNRAIHHVRRALLRQDGGGLTDAQLLEGFLIRHEEAAFEALVRRHGPMVLGVCRRVLNNAHDADDAFQATFLVLVRKATSIVSREMVGNWLYGVAYRTALKARAASARRQAKEREMSRPEAQEENIWRELQPLLDRELNRLPDKYRVPVVLCDLEGRTRKEAARQLGWPEGTLSGRLARARVMLARRLTRFGLAVSGGALALALTRNAAASWLPRPLVAGTVKAAVHHVAGGVTAGVIPARVALLTEGVVKGMLMTKLKTITAVVLAVSMLGVGVGAAVVPGPALPPRDVARAQTAEIPITDKEKTPSTQKRLPAQPMFFTQALASMDSKGKVKVRMMLAHYLAEQGVTPDGAKVTYYRSEVKLATKRYRPDEIQAFDTEGKVVQGKTLGRLLKEEVLALVFPPGQKVDPLHLRLIKKGTLVLVLPAPKEVAPPAVMPPLPVGPALPPPAVQPPGAIPLLPPPVKKPGRLAPPAVMPALPIGPALPPPAVQPPGAIPLLPPARKPGRLAPPAAQPPVAVPLPPFGQGVAPPVALPAQAPGQRTPLPTP